MIGIYKITNKINGHSYIGQSINIITRWNHHRNFSNKNSNYPLYLAFQKYGIDNFTFEVLEECDTLDLDSKEMYYIKLYDTYRNGYNQTEGGSGSKGYFQKISQNDLYEIYDLLINSNISQQEIATMFQVGEDTISEINNGKTRILENFTFPLRKNKKDRKYCIDCGAEIYYTSTRCNICEKIASRVTDRPNREELKYLIRNNSFVSIGKQFGVSDNTIRKWCDSYNLPTKKNIIKTITDKEWEQI